MYGVLNMLRSLIIQYKPSHVAVVFDAKKAKHSVMSCMRNINLIAHQCQMICVSRLSLLHEMVPAMGFTVTFYYWR